MKARIGMIDATETAYALRRALGPQRAWGDFLSDIARGRSTHFRGCTLAPAAFRRDRCRRPMYAKTDVARFIKEVWLADPSLRRDWSALESQEYLVPMDAVPWTMKAAEEC